jgi:uncharacterized protein YjbJ (UPF0337 family)
MGMHWSNEDFAAALRCGESKTNWIGKRTKEAAGALTGHDKLCEEGKSDQAVGKAKQAAQ